ncbi:MULTISPECIES: bifunctional 3-phenylpropionate/cinnamic acid dioxygenase ferredoxin subunit [Mycobacterium]|uniref:bifunctional 3-phenylpropionate/cinnamic acid dioxygenase ferredoxin subunit n=1 Tax=Mycobacterium TaxID=1763 RepID=UPI00200DBE13|nr:MULTISPECIES: bifunctional 3-phenylpropionate/cinnamic acid dioxygenase ferredoxin subunit [Mycobacterium]UQB93092.1 bifunctional 3-phenylpropionate/cinnamic acid dioxygenase ferredoxin subunit [Mycobacterium intracellulare]WSE46191.1 bifunctional 3-phenylpropionate/cinnamic acid dioxygenase ferredoxin subunit [Mycobacterium sp. 3-98]
MWKRACAVDEVASGEAIIVDNDPPIAVFHVDGEWFATEDRCSHDDSSLADGYVEGAVVECAWHFAKFCLRTGKVLAPPARLPLATFDTKVDGGVVYVNVKS